MKKIAALSDIQMLELPSFVDDRGGLTVISENVDVPISFSRVFFTYNAKNNTSRGSHAHKTCSQFLLCPYGAFEVEVSDGTQSMSFKMENPAIGLFIPPLIWSTQKNYSAGAVCLVLASEKYDPNEYLRDFDKFKELRSELES
jgi:dTDP-4-dehydrorhamnose 3,5-epimerase-like enzyme